MSAQQWWGTWPIGVDGVLDWRIGPLELAVERRATEWRLGFESSGDALDTLLSVAEKSDPARREALGTQERLIVPGEPDHVTLTPALADRPFVVRPEHPFVITPGASVELFVSSPLWVRIGVAPPVTELRELPVFRPSDTWFGPATISGELGYAGRTHCRMRLADLPVRPHRAITLVRLRNRTEAPFQLQRLSVPVPLLSLFEAGQGGLWTQALEVERDGSGALSKLEVDATPPAIAGPVEPVAGPRREPQRDHPFRALEGLFQ